MSITTIDMNINKQLITEAMGIVKGWLRYVYAFIALVFLVYFIISQLPIYGILAIMATVNGAREAILSKLDQMLVDHEPHREYSA